MKSKSKKKPTDKYLKKCIKETECEIEHYQVSKKVAANMRLLAELGFEPSGHGCGVGGEDWSFCSKTGSIDVTITETATEVYYHISLSNNNFKKIRSTIKKFI